MTTLVTAPATEPVSLEEALNYLRVDNAAEAPLVEQLITVGRETVENFTGRALFTQTRRLTLDAWPAGRLIDLPGVPLQSVTSVKYYPADGTAQTTWDSGNYVVITATNQVCILDGVSWPSLATRPDAVEITYVAGATSIASVPMSLKAGILFMAAHYYQNRLPVAAGQLFEIPMSLKHILESHRVEGWLA
jgi:uncharacterized phiE125 gp8 family phage protein